MLTLLLDEMQLIIILTLWFSNVIDMLTDDTTT